MRMRRMNAIASSTEAPEHREMLLLNPIGGYAPAIGGFEVVRGAFPFVGHVPALASDPLTFIRDAELRHGPFFFIEGASRVQILVCAHPDALAVFKSKVVSSSYMRDVDGGAFGESVIVQDGKVHQRMRAVLNGPFTPRGLAAAELGPLVADIIERRVRRFERGEPIRVLAETREIALEVIFRLIGIAELDFSEWRKRYQQTVLLLINLPIMVPGSPRWQGHRGKTWIDARLHEQIDAERSREPGRGLLSALVHGKGAEGETLADHEIVDNLRLLLLAGHETSASTMAWVVAFLAQHPQAWARLTDEVRAFGRIPTNPGELRQLPFTEAVFREALRLYPPVPFDARLAQSDLVLRNRVVPKGTWVSIPILHLSRHRDLHDRPDEFRPDRWLGRTEPLTPLELIQFGAGPHFCLGYHLAWMEIMQFAAALALSFGMRGPHLVGKPPAPRYVPLLHPSTSLRVVFR